VAKPRYTQIDVDATPYYHCISRCVRRAFLCGQDGLTGRNFDHRKAWVVGKLAELSEIFAIRICAYAVLSNHFHLVLRIDTERARTWSDGEIVERHGRLFRHTAEHWKNLPPSRAADRVACWRARLSDPSWFMRCLNESIARRANREDGCTGRFWEGRFRSQALLDEAGLLTCMTYVDLNPIRAGIAGSLEDSDFTSIQQRLDERACEEDAPMSLSAGSDLTRRRQRPALVGFAAQSEPHGGEVLPLALDAYVELLAATGAAMRTTADAMALPDGCVRTLERLGIRSAHWLEALRGYRGRFFSMVGCVHTIAVYCARTDRRQAKGTAWAGRVFRNCA
jgi:REP element-mobilizing transposase RayT